MGSWGGVALMLSPLTPTQALPLALASDNNQLFSISSCAGGAE